MPIAINTTWQQDVSVAPNVLTRERVVHKRVPNGAPETRHHGEGEHVYWNRLEVAGEHGDVYSQVVPTIGRRHAGDSEHLRVRTPFQDLFLVTRSVAV